MFFKTYAVKNLIGGSANPERVANEHALPFDPLIPNAKTIKAMKAARRGKLTPFTGIDELMLDLNADD